MYKEIKGNVLTAKITSPTLIPHICNDRGAFGAGFAAAVAKKYPDVKTAYKDWYHDTLYDIVDEANDFFAEVPFVLGEIQVVNVKENLAIVNMIAQSQPGGTEVYGQYLPPIRYECLKECMLRVAEAAKARNAEIRAPWFGCGLAGGDKQKVKQMIQELWYDFDVTMYEYP